MNGFGRYRQLPNFSYGDFYMGYGEVSSDINFDISTT